MNVRKLNKAQLIELKQRHLIEKMKNISLEELLGVDSMVSDEEIYKEYECVCFTNDDFFCSMEEDEDIESSRYMSNNEYIKSLLAIKNNDWAREHFKELGVDMILEFTKQEVEELKKIISDGVNEQDYNSCVELIKSHDSFEFEEDHSYDDFKQISAWYNDNLLFCLTKTKDGFEIDSFLTLYYDGYMMFRIDLDKNEACDDFTC